MLRRFATGTAALALLCCATTYCLAVIEALTPLEKFYHDATAIASVKVEKLDLEKQTAILVLERELVGTLEPPRLPLRLGGDREGNPSDMLDRLEVGQRLVLFVTQTESQNIAYAYTRGSWFQIIGTRDGDRVRWQFTHAEPYLRRTFSGETNALIRLILVAGGDEPFPPPKSNEPPGLGPKIDRTAAAGIEPDLPTVTTCDSGGEPLIVETIRGPQFDLRPWYAVLATVVIGLAGIAVLRLRGAPPL